MASMKYLKRRNSTVRLNRPTARKSAAMDFVQQPVAAGKSRTAIKAEDRGAVCNSQTAIAATSNQDSEWKKFWVTAIGGAATAPRIVHTGRCV